ncbi:MAG: hypothetical protein DLM57_01700 [Pseudonocardiales bacterium]|nr:MAG: hypothetical protein DLM57_01700 [Pseudonocardiales bacterium]
MTLHDAHPPTTVTLVRLFAAVQVAVAGALGAVSLVFAINSFTLDRAARRAGDPSAFAGVGEVFGAIATLICVASVLLIGIPLLRLRAGDDRARIGLILGEILGAVPMALALGISAAGAGPSVRDAGILLFDLLPVVVIVLLCAPRARTWSTRRPPGA